MAESSLKRLLGAGQIIVAPGVFDLISAKIADTQGFSALYMTGFGTVASSLGLPDAGLATLTQMVDRVETIADATTTPLIADADTGFGGLLNVRHTVRAYESAGASAIQLEDQEFPKKCGHTPWRRVIAQDDMVRKLQVALDSRRSDDFLIVARTDARTALGLDVAIDRANAYGRAGADIVFVEAPESDAEVAAIAQRVDYPLLFNMVDGGGRTPRIPTARLRELGFAVAIFPSLGFLAAGAALRSAFASLRATSDSEHNPVELYGFREFCTLMGFEDVWAFERQYIEETS